MNPRAFQNAPFHTGRFFLHPVIAEAINIFMAARLKILNMGGDR
jgi:hypothetical protein